MQIVKVIGSPLNSFAPRSALARLDALLPRSLRGMRQAWMPIALSVLMVAVLGVPKSANAQTLEPIIGGTQTYGSASGFRIYLEELIKHEPQTETGGSTTGDPTLNKDDRCTVATGMGNVQRAVKALSTMTVSMPENSTASDVNLTYEWTQTTRDDSPVTTDGHTASNPNFRVCGVPEDAQVSWGFSANRSTGYQGFEVTAGPDYGTANSFPTDGSRPDANGAGGALSRPMGDPEVDYESFSNPKRAFTLKVLARYSGGGHTPRETSVTVYVEVTDEPEGPEFTDAPEDDEPYEFSISENVDGSTTPVTVGAFTVKDPDDPGAIISYAVTAVTDLDDVSLAEIIADYQVMAGANPKLQYKGEGPTFDESSNPPQAHVVTVSATSTGQSASADFRVAIIDQPMYSETIDDMEDDRNGWYGYDFALKEGTVEGTTIGAVSASSSVPGSKVTYAITERECLDTPSNAVANFCIDGPGGYDDSVKVDRDTGALIYTWEDPVPSFVPNTTIADIELTITATEETTQCRTDASVDCETSLAKVVLSHSGAQGILRFVPSTPLTVTMPTNSAVTTALSGDLRKAAGGRAPYTYSLSPTESKASLFNIGATDGRLYYTGPGESADFSLTLVATDAANRRATRKINVDVGGSGGGGGGGGDGGGGGGGSGSPPTFVGAPYVWETLDLSGYVQNDGLLVGTVTVEDPDDGDESNLTLALSGSGSDHFDISHVTGQVTYTAEESAARASYTLTVTVTDRGNNSVTALITISQPGSTAPAFSQSSYTFTLAENRNGSSTPIGLGEIKASVVANVAIGFALGGAPSGDLFRLGTTSSAAGAYSTNLQYHGTGADFESTTKSFSFQVMASTSDSTVSVPVTVNITNVNEAPSFANTAYAFSIKEDIASGAAVGTAVASDPDAGDAVRYGLSGTGASRFAVAQGKITYNGPGEDFETPPNKYTLTLTATDRGNLSGTTTVTIDVTNVIEAPVFGNASYAFNLQENRAGPLDIGPAVATHPENLTFTYSLSGSAAANFAISSAGMISYVGSGEDFESDPKSYAFMAVVTDTRNKSGQANVTVTIQDQDEAPMFARSRYDFALDENVSGPESLGMVAATDPENDQIVYTLEGADATFFNVDGRSGEVSYTGQGEDYENGPGTYKFDAVAIADGGEDKTSIVVTIRDVNEAPAFAENSYRFDLKENLSGPVDLGSAVATDPDGNSLSYSLSGSGASNFQVNNSGEVSYVGSGEDYESTTGPFKFMVTAKDPGDLKAEAEISVYVTDQNEAPSFDAASYNFSLSENMPGPVMLGMTQASDPDNDVLQFSISGGDSKFAIDASGEVRYTGTGEDFEGGPGSYSLTATATDVGGLMATTAVNVTILDENEAPMVSVQLSAIGLQVGTQHTTDISGTFTDPDGDALVYTATTTQDAVVGVSVSGNQLQVVGLMIGTATVTVVATDPDGLQARTDMTVDVQASRAERSRTLKYSLAAMARAIGTEAVEVIGGRMMSSSSRNHVNMMGHSLSCGLFGTGQDCSWQTLARSALGMIGLHAPMPAASRLHMTPGASVPGARIGGRRIGIGGIGNAFAMSRGYAIAQSSFLARRGAFTIWGQGNAGGFEGAPDNGFSMEGSTSSMYFGADYNLSSRFMLGLAMSITSGEVDYMSSLNGGGKIDVSMTAYHPYLRFTPRDGLDIWGVFGAGTGSADIAEEMSSDFSTDLSMALVALGVRQELSGSFALKADVFSVNIVSDANRAYVEEVDAGAQRLRLAPEYSIRRSDGTSSYSGNVSLGLRVDDGDVDSGFGAEGGIAGRYAHAPSGLSIDLRARTLLLHQAEDFSDWGASIAVRLTPGGDEGLALSVEPSWGNSHGGADALMRQEGSLSQMIPYRQSGTGTMEPDRIGVRVGYKVPANGRTRVAPFGRWTNNASSGYQVQAGTRFAMLTAPDSKRKIVSLDVFAEQHVQGSTIGNTRVGLRGIVKFN